ncbi:uncharacterized protein BXZ73DRAFT_98580 [Epithele typhae]|uniref:uncharacterized protein n=1 Tax=Epithele typhae TaxID=378194 RepID=UPI002008CCA2|nr:uncharacterized protein BXZ73DRAFT_98580 [Epithele typhae]KAH9940749.1 hypothetical protein BXZ73DRAFT_98580 [Epithele typhae]
MSTLYTTTYPNTQLAQVQPAQRPAYAFLAYPPPQKKRPTQPLPSPPAPKRVPCSQPYPRRRSASSSAISTWSPPLLVRLQPFPPPVRVQHPALGHLPRPERGRLAHAPGDHPQHRVGLQAGPHACGYTSVFVHCPDTPLSATIPLAFAPGKQPARGLKHFRSLTALKTARRARSKSGTMQRPPSSPLKSPTHHASRAASRAQAREAVSASKKSKYAKFRPPPLATELALAQLADGGPSRITSGASPRRRPRRRRTRGPDGRLVGVADVYRDGAGGVWRDQDEEWEYAHLLGGDEEWCESEASWHSAASADSDDRRGSVSSADSDLDPRYAMQAEDEGRDDLAAFGSALAPACARRPGMSVLAIPARTRRTAPHLRKPEFLLDAFPVPPAFKCPTNPLDPLKGAGADGGRSPSPREASSKKTSGKIGMRGLFRAMGGKKGDL